MTTSDLASAPSRNKITEQMNVISDQRRLISDLEAQGQSARPERALLRELLRTFEGTLAELRHKSDDPASRDAASEMSGEEPVSESRPAVLTK